MTTLTGKCSRCGICCTADVNGVTVACEHLRHFQWVPLGKPESTYCSAYTRRYDGMPITMRNGAVTVPAFCSKDSDNETAIIVTRGIASGRCSLTVAP